MRIRTLRGAGIALAALTMIGTTANARSFDRSAFGAGNPEAWEQFGYAVETRDYDLPARMMNDARYNVCGSYQNGDDRAAFAHSSAILRLSSQIS